MPRDDAGRALPTHLDPRAGRARPGPPSTPPPRRGTRWPALAARTLAGLLAVAVLGGSGWGWYLAGVAEASLSRTDAIPGAGNTDVSGDRHAGRSMNLLLVGRDSRAGLTPEQVAEYSTGDTQGLLNTDSMMLAHVPADGSAAAFVSIPRDLYVPIPGHGSGKINSAFGAGHGDSTGTEAEKDAAGARLLIQTVSHVTGLQIDHYAEVDLAGFIDLTEIVGGVQVNLCEATSDVNSGADFPAGVQTISGPQALQFVRQRDGLPRTDIDRQVRQQVFLAGMIRNTLSRELLLDPAGQREVIEQIGSSVTVDQGLGLLDLATQMQSVQLGAITFQTVPGLADERNDAGAVLVPVDEQAMQDFFAALGTDPVPAAPPADAGAAADAPTPGEITVSVLNGSGVTGAAATAAAQLGTAGFLAASGGNADPLELTTVRHRSEDAAAAAVVAAQLPGAALLADDTLTPGAGVVLVLGADSRGVGTAVTPPDTGPGDGTYAVTERTAEDTSCIA